MYPRVKLVAPSVGRYRCAVAVLQLSAVCARACHLSDARCTACFSNGKYVTATNLHFVTPKTYLRHAIFSPNDRINRGDKTRT